MKTFHKLSAWIIGTLATVPLAFGASLWYWTSVVNDEYRTGARVSTDGDTVMIPAMEDTVVWIFVLAGLNLILLAIWLASVYRRSRLDVR
jgi:hypothetical protein